MIDQCKHCVLRGDIDKCEATPCSHHQTWYAETLCARLAASAHRVKFVESVNAKQEQFVCNTLGKALGFPTGPEGEDICCGDDVLESLCEMGAKRIAESEQRVKALEETLRESILQIEYMHTIFQETGSGNAVLSRLKALEATCRK